MVRYYSIIIPLLIILISFSAYSATYYIDSENGNDSKAGTSEDQAWKTISKVNSKTLQPGDVVLFKSEGKWREQLNIKNSGSSSSPITIGSYGNGNKPVISGANLITQFSQYSASVWRTSSALPRQVFFNNIRGEKKNSVSDMTEERDWYFSSGFLYIKSSSNPASAYSTIEAAIRHNSININAKNVIIKDLQVEKTFNEAVYLTVNSENITVDNLDFIQWTNEINAMRGGITIAGKNCVVKNSTFGKNTGNDITDQNWAGFVAIVIAAPDAEIFNNKIYHTSLENEESNGKYAYGIRVYKTGGITKIHSNHVYHTGSNGILVDALTNSGDEIRIFENTISHTGQAGISAYKTRGSDGTGGKGYIYKNNVSFANRLGGEVGGGGNRAGGIHFNDGVQSGVNPSQSFIKWYCYENVVHSSQSLNERNSPDSDGIAIDYNANGVEVYKNLVYNNDGKGMYIWNADNCRIYYNVVYGNDCGITVTAAGKNGETTNNNEIFNNVFYKNHNGDNRGPNYDTEIYLGLNGNNNKFINNILFSSANGVAYYFNANNSSGCLLDHNLVYSENGSDAVIGHDSKKGKQTFAQWRSNHSSWDNNSINADPLFKDPNSFDFRLKPGSPAINRGMMMGLLTDFIGLPVIGSPDIGAFEIINLVNSIKIKVFLEGAFENGIMNTTLSEHNILPLTNPYNIPPWNYPGDEILSSAEPDFVDWILIELRSGLSSSEKAAQRALILKKNGSVVDISGSEDITFNSIPAGEYYIIVYHRNHLPVMSSVPVDLTAENAIYDFTVSASNAYGDNSLSLLNDGSYAMPAGDSDANGIIDDTDFAETGNGIFQNGYKNTDLDMNQIINILDYGKSLNNIGRRSQIPD